MLELVARLPSLSVEVFLHRKFGERYLTGGMVVASGLFVHAAGCLIAGVSPFEWRGASLGTALFLVAFAGFSLGHRYEIGRRNRSGLRWYSWSDGVSWRVWGLTPFRQHFVQARLEPAVVLVAGWALLTVDRVLGSYLIATAVILFLKAGRTLQRRKEAWLDYIDKTIESEELDATVLERRPARETRGLVVATGGAVHRRALAEMASVIRSTDEGLKALAEAQAAVARAADLAPIAPSPPAGRMIPAIPEALVSMDQDGTNLGDDPFAAVTADRAPAPAIDDWAHAFLRHRRRERRRRFRGKRAGDDAPDDAS